MTNPTEQAAIAAVARAIVRVALIAAEQGRLEPFTTARGMLTAAVLMLGDADVCDRAVGRAALAAALAAFDADPAGSAIN